MRILSMLAALGILTGRPVSFSPGGNKYKKPHQGKQECLRRRINGFRGDKRALIAGL